MSCAVGEVTESLENELCSFRHFIYVTAHFLTLLSFLLRHSSFSNPSFASPTSQALHFRHLASRPCLKLSSAHSLTFPSLHLLYVTAHSPNLPLLYLRHSSFSNPSVALLTSQLILQHSFASPKSQAFNLRHLASRP